jgi:phage/plasmid-like protein (TIGR03299 family)
MAHEIDMTREGGAAFYAFKPAWHGLGMVLDYTPTADVAIEKAGLDWQVELAKVQYVLPTIAGMRYATAEGKFVTYRADTGAALGVVGDDYTPLQNREAFAALSTVLEEAGLVYESAGSLKGGRKIWLLARDPQDILIGIDAVRKYYLLTTAHDGSAMTRILPTGTRVVCANTLAIALNSKEGFAVRHTSGQADRIKAARGAFTAAGSAMQTFEDEANKLLASRVLPQSQVAQDVMRAVLVAAFGDPNAPDLSKAARDRKVERVKDAARDVSRRLGGATGTLTAPNTAWALFNAISEWVDHGQHTYQGSQRERAENRFQSVLTGKGNGLKQLAWAQLLAA